MPSLLKSALTRYRNFQKVIFHLEAFVAKFMRIVERYVLSKNVFYLAQTINAQ